MSASSPSSTSLLKKINLISSKQRPFRVAVLGQNGVGKSALTVRFITRRFIGDYDPQLERVYSCQRTINNSTVDMEIWDTAGTNEHSKLREHIRWADGILLMYDVTDRCSFNECSRLKFLINAHSRRSRRKSGSDPDSEMTNGIPVALVANKKDREQDRMVLSGEGVTRSLELNCISFHELSVRENVDEVLDVLEEFYITCRNLRKYRSMTLSKISLIPDKGGGGNSTGSGSGGNGNVGSSSEEDADEGGGRGLTLRMRGRTAAAFNGGEGDSISRNEMIRRAKSRRREAFYTLS